MSAAEQGTLFDERFLGRYAGSIMSDPTTALVELVANSWDAYATTVDIIWPDRSTGTPFSISDNGIGMTPDEFAMRWRTLEYNRATYQGVYVNPPADLQGALPRAVYGRNGRGRHAAFLFSSPYRVRTWRNGREVSYQVAQGKANPIEITRESLREGVEGHGTEVSAIHFVPSALSSVEARGLLSTRFLMNPEFAVFVDGVRVTFSDVPSDNIDTLEVDVEGYGTATILVIDSQRADRTSKQHGIAWWVNRRLVGQGGWGIFDDKFIDGRTEEAKRFTFIVHADFLASAVLPDWSDFKQDDAGWVAAQPLVQDAIRQEILNITREKRAKARETVRENYRGTVCRLSVLSRERWNKFLDKISEECPNLTETQIDQVMGLLAKLETAQSQYSLLEKLHELSANELDELHDVLDKWTISTAKIVLDEIAKRLRLIEEIRAKTEDPEADEVQELQPLFGQALWIFGPQFESLEFTSNRGMTTVIKNLFGGTQRGSLNRPDFAMTPQSSIGFYSRPSFDREFNEDGIDILVIVELKRPGIRLTDGEKGQVWKYVKELISKGYVTDRTTVYGYVLGDSIEAADAGERTEGTRVFIRPLLYSTFIGQAEKRMLSLHKRLMDAPFMKGVLAELMQDVDMPKEEPAIQRELLETAIAEF